MENRHEKPMREGTNPDSEIVKGLSLNTWLILKKKATTRISHTSTSFSDLSGSAQIYWILRTQKM